MLNKGFFDRFLPKYQDACLQRAVLRDGGSNPADNFVRNWTLLPRSKCSVSRHLAKPLGRYLQAGRKCIDRHRENL